MLYEKEGCKVRIQLTEVEVELQSEEHGTTGLGVDNAHRFKVACNA